KRGIVLSILLLSVMLAFSLIAISVVYAEENQTPVATTPSSGSVCGNGACESGEEASCTQDCGTQTITCTDSDGGKNYDVKGTANDKWGERTDSCQNEKQITEYYCQDDGTGKLAVWTIGAVDCPYGCSDGACLPAPTPVCGNNICDNEAEKTSCSQDCTSLIKCSQNSECGQATTTKSCGSKIMPVVKSGQPQFDSSYACKSESSCYCQSPGTYNSVCQCSFGESCNPCQYGCKEGECISGTDSNAQCTDSDGIDYYNQGKACIDSSCQADMCVGNTLLEYGCENNNLLTYNYWCPSSCQNGACIKGETSKEQVTCIFANSKTKQECVASSSNGQNRCSGVETCTVDVSGQKGDKIVWKSTCGGYAYTVLDGNNEYAKFECAPIATPTPVPPEETAIGFRNAYWQCYDGTEDKQGGETSCKPSEIWQKYAQEACNKRCITVQPDKEKCLAGQNCAGYTKCGANSFAVYNECSLGGIIVQPVCGNGICESGEWQVCEITAATCKENETCKASVAKCYVPCAKDCPKGIEGVYAKLDEQFKLQMSQEVKFENYQNLVIKFNDLFVPGCAAVAPAQTTGTSETTEKVEKTAIIEKYSAVTGKAVSSVLSEFMTAAPTATQSSTAVSTCAGREPYAVLQLKIYGNNEKTEVIKIQLGERKQVFDLAVSFLDYDQENRMGYFIVSLASESNFTCPQGCICDISGSIKECQKIGECPEKQKLCPDGICRDKCEITNITTECKFGCFYQDKCLPYGLRISGLYCSVSNGMKTQAAAANESCENNFECKSNVCIDEKCISSSLIKKFLDWFKGIFGGE
ncbi:MAG TPA: hypothetical protein VJA86_02605, partial [Candidatus Nanoarchaeia archaeon]|nr:hypothetical protein [Candidatus Nanoarchaeia archaeon]